MIPTSRKGVPVRIGAVVHARMSSSRLPGKVLAPIGGRPLLAWLVDGLRTVANLDTIGLATSTGAEDDVLDAFAREQGIACYRGPLEDLAARVSEASDVWGLDAFVRVNGDSPLLDPALVARGVALMRAAPVDLVSNVAPPRSFPAGQSVEVIDRAALLRLMPMLRTSSQREHVTTGFYEFQEVFRIARFWHEPAYDSERMTVDTAEDLADLDWLLSKTDAPWRMGWLSLLHELTRHRSRGGQG
jgi:spore coat polysaccharide biosynthesis protein SpsF (cytidylyltransferase family)